jgi:hypothetical protein
MLWLVLALVAALLGGGYALLHDLQPAAIVLLAVALGLVFVIGRRVERGRDLQWQAVAAQWHARFLAAPQAEQLRRFGAAAPWDGWARDGAPQCARAIDGSTAQPPFAILQVRYPVREARGEDAPEQWHDVVVAVVRSPNGRTAGVLRDVAAGDGYAAASNGEFVFVWRRESGPGEVPDASELVPLLRAAQRLARATNPP